MRHKSFFVCFFCLFFCAGKVCHAEVVVQCVTKSVFVLKIVFLAYRGVMNNPIKNVRDSLVNQCAQILACYRKNCASPSSAGQVKTAASLITANNRVTDYSIAVCTTAMTISNYLVALCVADPPRVHEAASCVSQLCTEERCSAPWSRCLLR